MSGISTLFDTRSLLDALHQRRPAKAFLRNLFFRTVKTFETETVDIDIMKHKQRAAAFVRSYEEGPVVGRTGYETKTYKPETLKPKMVVTAADAFKRQPGEVLYSGNMTAMQRAATLVANDLMELDQMISRREEIMASQALISDAVQVVDVSGNKLLADISFGRASDHQVSDTDVTNDYGGLWDASASDPILTLRLLKRKVALDSGLLPDVAVFSAEATDLFVNHPLVRDRLRDTRSDQVMLNMQFPNFLADGAMYVGTIEGLAIFEYVEQYLDDWTNPAVPALTPMIPAKHILLGSRDARSEMLYGAIPHLSSLAAVSRFPYSWQEDDPPNRFLQLYSRPLPSPHQVDGFIVAQIQA